MEILDLRQLRAYDLEPLLEEEKLLWRQRFHWDYSNSADLIRRFVESRSLPGYAAMEDGRAVGYCFFVYEEQKGLIGNLYVTAAHRGPTENTLLTHAIETLQGTPGIRRIESQLMIFPAGSLDSTFGRDGFSSQTRRFMYYDFGPAAVVLPPRDVPDFEFRSWSDALFEDSAALITRAYRDHVDGSINDQYRSLAGAVRFLRNIIHFPGCGVFCPEASWGVYRKGQRQLCGLILTSVVEKGIGHVTQVCAAQEFQGAGLGYEMVRRAAGHFCALGFAGLSLTVTSANLPAVRLYERMGFRALQEFSAYVWSAS